MKLHIAYDGTGYLGWQKQTKQNGPTIQGCLEQALFDLTGEVLITTGSGRTDAGVHAKDQVVYFKYAKDNFDRFDWIRGLNRYLPESIRAQKAFWVDEGFHPVKSATSKTYIYSLQDGPAPDPISIRYSHWVPSKIDTEYLNKISKGLIGKHDFKSFQTVGTPLATTVRTLTQIEWIRTGENTVEAQISGTGFLKQMVRNLVGTLMHQYWSKKLSSKLISDILAAKDRKQAFGTAPAHGLCLLKVNYPPELDKNCTES